MDSRFSDKRARNFWSNSSQGTNYRWDSPHGLECCFLSLHTAVNSLSTRYIKGYLRHITQTADVFSTLHAESLPEIYCINKLVAGKDRYRTTKWTILSKAMFQRSKTKFEIQLGWVWRDDKSFRHHVGLNILEFRVQLLIHDQHNWEILG